jgi:ATP-dependent DNA ligase
VVLDGEVVYVDENGVPDFNFTARCMGSGLEVCQEKQRADGKYLSYFVFDILYLNENDPRPQSYAFRRGMLESLFDEFGRFIEGDPYVKLVESVPPSAAEHGRFLDQFGEGSIWKALLAPYPGKRHASWLKYKDQPTEDVIIMGFKPGEGKYEGQIGAVQFGQIRGGRVQTRGYCSGMTDDKRKWITDNIGDLVGQVLQIKTYGILGNGGFRHPQWGHIRDDKAASECVWTN